jgi:hypothetical protein
MDEVTLKSFQDCAELPITFYGSLRLHKWNGMEVRRQRTDFLDFGGGADQKVLVVAIEFSESSDYVADIGAYSELSHTPDVDGDFH